VLLDLSEDSGPGIFFPSMSSNLANANPVKKIHDVVIPNLEIEMAHRNKKVYLHALAINPGYFLLCSGCTC
jgi:hypothetical protein